MPQIDPKDVVLFLGPNTASPFGDGVITIIKQGASLQTKHVDNVILYGHGQVMSRNTKDESHIINLLTKPEIFEFSRSTIEEVLKIMKATTPKHVDLVSCFGGAIGADIRKKENFDRLIEIMKKNGQKDLTISVTSSSKHPTFSVISEAYIADILSTNASEDPGIQRVGLMRNIPETLKQYRIHIDEKGQASLIGFKIRSPKHSLEIDHPERFIGSHILYEDKTANKEKRSTTQVVTEMGQDDLRHDALLSEIQHELLKDGHQFSLEYMRRAVSLSATREKPALMKKWISAIPSYEGRLTAIFSTLNQQINFKNPELIRALVDATPQDLKTSVIEDLIIRKAKKDWETESVILGAITQNEKVETLYNTLSNEETPEDTIKNNMAILLSYIDVNTKDDDGNTIIHRALQSKSETVDRVLIELLIAPSLESTLNIDITSTNNEGHTILDLARIEDKPKIKEYIINHPATIKSFANAVKTNDIETIQKCLMTGMNPSAQDNLKRSMLHLASDEGNIGILKLLLSANADLTSLDGGLHTPLDRAHANAHANSFTNKTIPFLEEAEEDRKNEQKMALNIDKSTANFQICDKVLKHDIASVQSLLQGKGADVNARNLYGDPLINIAVRFGDTEMVKLLLEAGADPTIKGRFGDTALKIATEYGNQEVIALLEIKHSTSQWGRSLSG